MHLGMSGRLLILPGDAPLAAHEHVRVRFADGIVLAYRDPRRFGWMRVAARADLEEIARLGAEPLNGDFGAATLRRGLRATRRDVKAALLDQRVVAGIGNIYANEILFRAGVRPTRRCHRLTDRDIAALARATKAVLTGAVERRGTSFSDYFDSDGIPGTFQDVLAVFDRAGKPCRRCGATIKRRPQGGRSSFYCSTCQR
jgi:formamidopyrimidine-DNA glycosylase